MSKDGKDRKLHIMGVSSQRNSSVGLNPVTGMSSAPRGHTKNNISEVYGTVMNNNQGHSQIELNNQNRGQSTQIYSNRSHTNNKINLKHI